jgi:hypothetical protein
MERLRDTVEREGAGPGPRPGSGGGRPEASSDQAAGGAQDRQRSGPEPGADPDGASTEAPPADGPGSNNDAPVKPDGIPVAVPVAGSNGFVFSPFAEGEKKVDVRNIPPGTVVQDPYTGRLFRVP